MTEARLALSLLLAAGVLYLAAIAATVLAGRAAGAVLLAPGVLACALSYRLMRGRRDDDDGGEDGGDPEPPPVDWDEFDRARGRWSRTPVSSL